MVIRTLLAFTIVGLAVVPLSFVLGVIALRIVIFYMRNKGYDVPASYTNWKSEIDGAYLVYYCSLMVTICCGGGVWVSDELALLQKTTATLGALLGFALATIVAKSLKRLHARWYWYATLILAVPCMAWLGTILTPR